MAPDSDNKRPLDLLALQKRLQAVDSSVVLVSPRILERVIREAFALPNMYFNIPHPKSFVCTREALFRHAEQVDVELQPEQILPPTVILLQAPAAEELSALERSRLLLKYWRRLFHSRVHLALEASAALTDEAIRERIEQIGRTEFEEVRNVLLEDRYLPPNPDDRKTFIEFAAVYLELRYFASGLLDNVFPGLVRDFGKIEKFLARDLNPSELFVKTRLADAPDPIMNQESRTEESQETYWKLVRQAQATQKENLVRAAIIRMRASRIAPAAQTLPTRVDAERNIAELANNLAETLQLTANETPDWARHLQMLLDKADQGPNTVEARVLFELQSAWLSHKSEVYTLDLVEWVTSMGKRPIKRPLPSQKMVRVIKHLRGALAKLTEVRLSDTDRGHLERLLAGALRSAEERLRTRFGPVLITAMEDVGLKPNSPVERVAFDKMVAELLDRIIHYGFVTFSELRDTISRNQLKLPDVNEPEHFLRGDPLIRLDRRLASLLDGVYRPGEFYVRYLERACSLGFGTWWGRWVTRYVTGPFLFAWVILFVLGLLLEEADSFMHSGHIGAAVQVLMGPAYMPKGGALLTGAEHLAATGEDFQPERVPWYWHTALVVLTGLFVMALFYNAGFRRRVGESLAGLWRGLVYLFWRLPLRLLPIDAVQRLFSTWAAQLLYWYVLKPAAVTALFVFLVVPGIREHRGLLMLTFVLANVAVNSRTGRHASEGARDVLVDLATKIRAGLLLSIVRFILYVFKRVSEGIEYVLFSVDEWLRFRSGDSEVSMFVRTVLSVLWAPVAFLVRFYTVVLIEPMLNPLKLPISTIAAKILYPLLLTLNVRDVAVGGVEEVLPRWLAELIVLPTLFLLPDAFGFLAWEMKENWSLYRSNREEELGPVSVGAHGETVRGLLQPGFHSGTVPALFARLREAERAGVRTRDWQKARLYRHEVDQVEASLARFLARDVVAQLLESRAWKGEPLECGPTHLATNRIRFEILHARHPARPVEIEIEHNNYWILAGLRSRGWLDDVTAEQRRAFATCLAAMYKLADVDLVREQMQRAEGGPVTAARLTREGVQVWREPHCEPVTYRLRDGMGAQEKNQRRFVFALTTISWEMWTGCWEQDARGEVHPGLAGVNELVLPGAGGGPVLPLVEAPAGLEAVAPAVVQSSPGAVSSS